MAPSEMPFSGSCVSTGGVTLGVQTRRHLLKSATHLRGWTVFVEQTGQNAAVELDQVVSKHVRERV